jgi:CTP synthase
MSGIGKGITASSIGVCLKAHGLKVTAIKIDPYLNVDSGTMSPFEHGECYVLDDGGETDLDLGNYERFLDINLTKDHNITSGKIYNELLQKERKGDYLGKTVQIIPHFTNMVQEWIKRVSTNADICIIELGGTVGDIESAPFVESLRQLIVNLPKEDTLLVNVTYLIKLKNDLKTKPAQQGIKILKSLGLSPDILCVRSEGIITDEIKKKLSDFCHISTDHILINQDVSNIYEVPILFKLENIIDIIDNKLLLHHNPNFRYNEDKWNEWVDFSKKFYVEKRTTKKIAIVGKYVDGTDCYLSLTNAIKHACIHNDVNFDIKLVDSEEQDFEILKSFHAVIIPGGFGYRGIEGMILAAQVCRENNIPCLGICLGFQVMIIEFARNVLKLKEANSTEFSPKTSHPVVTIIDRTFGVTDPIRRANLIEKNENMGGTMRLGLQTTIMQNGDKIQRRHRHRYEFNPKYLKMFQNSDMKFIGWDSTKTKMDILSIGKSIGVQYHPEYTSRPGRPDGTFTNLLKKYVPPKDSTWCNGKEMNPPDRIDLGMMYGELKELYPNMEIFSIVNGKTYVDGLEI